MAATYNDNSKDYEDFQRVRGIWNSVSRRRSRLGYEAPKVVLVCSGASAFGLNSRRTIPQIKSMLWVPHPGQARVRTR